MDTSVLYNLPEFFSAIWRWSAHQDSRVSFAFGVATAIVIGRLFSIFANPAQKILAFAGFIVVAIIVLASWVSFAGVLQPGEIPFGKAASTPNAETLTEIQK
jgi:Zn-dependent protease